MTDSNFETDSKSSGGDLSKVSALAEKLDLLNDAIKAKEASLKQLKEQALLIESGDLPDLMDSIGLSEFKLSDGSKVKIKPIIKASLPSQINIEKQRDPEKRAELQERLDSGIEYLRDCGADSLIKNQLVTDINKGMDNVVEEIINRLQKDFGVTAQRNTSVNTQTLTAWVREMLGLGKDVPFETFSVFTGRKAVITKAR